MLYAILAITASDMQYWDGKSAWRAFLLIPPAVIVQLGSVPAL
jgi:hypothetical protein